MDAQSLIAGKHTLKRNLDKSLSKIGLSERGRVSLSDKNKIKKAAVGTLQAYLKNELKRTSTKTYDWYFFKEEDEVYQIEAFRNNLVKNRYFIVDHKQMPILSANAHGSTYGQQRVHEFDITSKQIGEIISSSAKLFADMMRITVSEKEDAKIYKAYNTVNEKKIIIVTIGLPAALLASAEAVPLMVMASKSSTFSAMTSSLGRAFVLNSGRQMGTNAGLEFGSQYISNGISNNDWGLSNIDMFDVGTSTIFGEGGDVILGSAVDFTYDKGYKFNSPGEFSENMLVGGAKFKASKMYDISVGNSIGNLSTSFGKTSKFGGQLTIQTVIESFRKEAGNNMDHDN